MRPSRAQVIRRIAAYAAAIVITVVVVGLALYGFQARGAGY